MKSLPPSLRSRQLAGYVCDSCTRQLRRQRRNYATTSSTLPTNPEIFDVVCVGGGPAGLSLVGSLRANPSTAGLRVALIESQSLTPSRTFSLPSTQYSNRCSSLTPKSVGFLKDIGAWSHVKRERVAAYNGMKVWDGVSGASISFDSEIQPHDPESGVVAYMNENLNLTQALLARVDEIGGVEILENQKVTSIDYGTDTPSADLSQWPVIQTSGGRSLAARLLVGADGGNSSVRTFAGIESRGWDYNRVGVVATLQMEGEGLDPTGGKVAYQRFLPSGPVACLPLPGNYATLVWSTTPELAGKLKALSAKDFISMVNAAFRLSVTDLKYLHTLESGQLEEVAWREKHTPFEPQNVPEKVVGVQEKSIASFPLKFRHADTYIGQRIALIGDAAHTVHPLAGQGLNQGQGDVEALAKAIAYSVEHGMDIGTRMNLERYEAERYSQNHLLMGVVDKLHKLYATENELVVGVRSLGLRAVDSLESVKGFFMRQASGRGEKFF